MGFDAQKIQPVIAAAPDAKSAAATAVANEVKAAGITSFGSFTEVATTILNDTDKKKADQREAVLLVIASLCKVCDSQYEPFLASMLPLVLAKLGDKAMTVQKAAATAKTALVGELLSPYSVKFVLPTLFEALTSDAWKTQEGALRTFQELAETLPIQTTRCLPEIIPQVSVLMNDAKKQVAQAARDAMSELCGSIGNKDIDPFVPALVSSIYNIEEVPECLHKLAGTTFVQSVSAAALSVITPLLVRGFDEKKDVVKRMCSVIIANMSKLVDDPSEAAPFLPKLMPCLERASNEVSDPEARGVCARASEQLNRIDEQVRTGGGVQNRTADEVLDIAKANLGKYKAEGQLLEALVYASSVCSLMVESRCLELSEWTKSVTPYLTPFMSADAVTALITPLHAKCTESSAPTVKEEDDTAEELCNCQFSLAYGTKILLHNTTMRLQRGRRYGLLGGNDSGKTTLMRSIANEQVDGFPPRSELRTVFVEADIQGEDTEVPNLDYVFLDERIKHCGASREDVATVMKTVGFSDKMLTDPVRTLSGGWRMKLALARAMLQKADILLLDEPTNHLDVKNVAWVQTYLMSLKDVTCIIVSHDSGLLDTVCTDILCIENLKLSHMKGNLSDFVAKNPHAKSFFELKASKFTFRFPQPSAIDGIKSRGKPLMKMDNVTFTYPINDKPTISNVTVRCSMASRVACVGVNGAGKSTMIKLLTGELVPDVGTVWKHPGCRLAYVAQHAFHHIEQHLTKTPNQYIQWRYQQGEDKEAIQKATMIVSDEELKLQKEPVLVSIVDEKTGKNIKEKRVVERLTGARRNVGGKGKMFEYEIKWENKSQDCNTYMTSDKLDKMAFTKIYKAIDERIASSEGQYKRPLTQVNIEKHLEDVGLDKEFGTHYRMSALSGGQKVKVVLAAAMWMQPHILILDEPTNYLDRESLGALAGAIETFEGGVVMITHNNEFCSKLCPETWVLENGTLNCKGDAEWMANLANEKTEFKQIEDMTDAFGNTVVVKETKNKDLSRKDKKKKAKLRAARIKRGEVVSSDDEDFDEV